MKVRMKYVYGVIYLFFISALVAFVFPSNFIFFNEMIKKLVGQIEGKGFVELIWFIFQNNISTSFLVLILGLGLGILPIFIALSNGAILGYVAALVSAENGLKSLLYILPHGIFELPAIFIALGLGIKLGFFVSAKKGKKAFEFKRRFLKSIKVFIGVVLPLLIIAAIIEGSFIYFGW